MIEGGCLCGHVRYRVERSHLSAVNCYCGMCRRAHGGTYSTHVPMRREQFQIVTGALEQFASSQRGRREFCGRCGTHVLVHGQNPDDSVAVPAGTLDGNPEVALTGHFFVREKVDWHPIRDDLPQYEGWPPGVAFTHVEDDEP